MTSIEKGGSPAGRSADKPRFPLLHSEGGMSPINIPIKPPPRVNTANGVNGGGDDDSGGEREKEGFSGGGGRVGGSANTRRERERGRRRGGRGRESV